MDWPGESEVYPSLRRPVTVLLKYLSPQRRVLKIPPVSPEHSAKTQLCQEALPGTRLNLSSDYWSFQQGLAHGQASTNVGVTDNSGSRAHRNAVFIERMVRGWSSLFADSVFAEV